MAGILASDQNDVFCSQLRCIPLNLTVLLFCICIATVLPEDKRVTCSIPSVQQLQDTVLTCKFPEDLSVTKKDFTIYHYVQYGSPDAVIDCWWLRGVLDCFIKPGFDFNKVVTSNATVTLRQVNTARAGTYACQVAGYGPGSSESCEFRINPGTDNTCSINYGTFLSQVWLTCFFNEDVGEMRRNFAVYKRSGETKQSVLECLWKGERSECQVEHGFLYNYNVSSHLILNISEVTKEKEGNYSCWHAGSHADQEKPCSLDVADHGLEGKTPDQSFKTLAIGLSVGLIVLSALVAAAVVFLLKYKGKTLCPHRQRTEEQDGEESQPMLEKESEPDAEAVTKNFQEHLVKEVSEMYPNLSESFYFVPPVYFNRNRYRPQTVAGQLVYVPDPPDPSDVRHDRAMQHVIHCLRHMAESEKERMFVLTQFQYEDYLNRPDPAYRHHRLPTPAGLREADSDVGCFDFLIVHRLHGLLVGVVKAVSNGLNVGHMIVQEVTQAVQQLKKAKRMIQHLMSDQQHFPNVRQTLIFPNLTRSSLQTSVRDHGNLVQNLRECLEANALNDPTKLCLCAEQLSDSNTPWDVSNTAVSNMIDCWKWTVTAAKDAIMADELYLNIIARFFGPATQSSLRVPEDYEHFSLPKTLPYAVYLTGDLFARLVLSPDLIELLDEPTVVLSGPPNSGKTTLLSLAGGKWLSSGYDVFVIKEKSSPNKCIPLQNLKSMKAKHDAESGSDPPFGSIHEVVCNFDTRISIKNSVERILERKTDHFLGVLSDQARLDRQLAKECYDALKKQNAGARLWMTCTNLNNKPELVYERHLTERLLSPPSVLREVAKVKVDSPRYVQANEANTYPPHTDGPPVKHVSHQGSGILMNNSPTDCFRCGRQVGRFLAKSLLIAGKDKVAKETHTCEVKMEETMKGTLGNASVRQTSRRGLQFRDILIVFEFTKVGTPDVKDDCNFLKGLRESGIMVRTVTDRNTDDLGDEDSDVALAVHVRHMDICKTKKKIVVYVESVSKSKHADRRRRTLLSCTSQLIWVSSRYLQGATKCFKNP